MKSTVEKLTNLNVGKIKENENLASYTTMKVGGAADIFIEPNSIESLEKVIKILNEDKIPYLVIGRGSNLLISDLGIEGAVIRLGNEINELEIDGTTVTVGAGYSLVALSTLISRKGLSGLEFASGIPGSVGGSVYMNAGAHGSEMKNVVKKVLILLEDGTLKWFTNEEMKFSYRTSVLQKEVKGIIVKVVFELTEGNKEEITAQMQNNKDYRKKTQPYNMPCSGSVFRNPLPQYAGRLIEEANLKGYSIGGAQISPMHANFIVNTGNAKAQDILDLIQFIQNKIYSLYNINLHTEVEIIGRKN